MKSVKTAKQYQVWIDYGSEGWDLNEFDTFNESREFVENYGGICLIKITEKVKLKEKKELICENCRRDYTTWFVENKKWNKVVGDDISFLCMDCFALLYEKKTGKEYIWELINK